MNWTRTADQIIHYAFYLLFFLVPLIWSPFNFELFEYNKMMLTYAIAVVVGAGWIMKMVASEKFLFKRTPLDIPLGLFFLGQFLSFVFSIDHHTSLWGYYSRFHGGLISTITYLLLYWAFVTHLNQKQAQTALKWLLGSALIVALYAALEHFGIDAQYWVQDVQSRVFSTLGQPNWLAAFLAIILPLPLALAYNSRKDRWTAGYWLGLFALFGAGLIFTKSRSGLPAAALALLFFLFFTAGPKLDLFPKKYRWPAGGVAVLILAAVIFISLTKMPGVLKDTRYIFGIDDSVDIQMQRYANGGSLSSDIRKIVWRGAFDVFKAHPIFGSGVETFAYSYYQYRPKEHNLISEWDFLYNKAHNEYFNFLATTGFLGFGTYLLFIIWFIVWAVKDLRLKFPNFTNDSSTIIALLAGWLSILVTNFFGFSVVPVAILFFLFPAIWVVLTGPKETPAAPVFVLKKNIAVKTKTKAPGTGSQLALVATGLVGFYLLFQLWQMWQADVAYARAAKNNKTGDYAQAYQDLQTATRLNPAEPIYKEELAWSAANLAYLYSTQKDNNNTVLMTNQSIDAINQAMAISSKNLNFYRTEAKIFYRLTSLNKNYLAKAMETLQEARKLAPTEAKIIYNLALVQENLGQRQEAIKTLEEVVALKTNYVDARYALALLYKDEKQFQKAIDQLTYLAKEINPANTEYPARIKELQAELQTNSSN